jgi:hypothetical protein
MFGRVWLAGLALVFAVSPAWSGCKSECRDAYESEVESCYGGYPDPDEASDLMMCIDSASGDYESCIQECDS